MCHIKLTTKEAGEEGFSSPLPSPGLRLPLLASATTAPLSRSPCLILAQQLNVTSVPLFHTETWVQLPRALSQRLLVSVWTCLLMFLHISSLAIQHRCHQSKVTVYSMGVLRDVTSWTPPLVWCFSGYQGDETSCHLTYRHLLANSPS